MKPYVSIERSDFRDGVDIKIGFRLPDGTLLRVKPCEMESHPPGDDVDIPEDPSIRVKRGGMAFLQALMDELWRLQVRPRDIGTAGHLAATQAHLAEVSGLLKQVLPKALRE